MKNRLTFRVGLLLVLICSLIFGIMLFLGKGGETGPFVILLFLGLALALRGKQVLRGFSFSLLIFAAVSASLFYPGIFREVGGFDLKKLIIPLLMIIMFGMGTAMSFGDFMGVIKCQKASLSGLSVSLPSCRS